MTIRSRFPNRLQQPPSTFTGDQAKWLQRLTDEINKLPPMSVFSGDPNSAVTAGFGALGFNVGTSSVTSVVWVKQLGSSNTGWKPVG